MLLVRFVRPMSRPCQIIVEKAVKYSERSGIGATRMDQRLTAMFDAAVDALTFRTGQQTGTLVPFSPPSSFGIPLDYKDQPEGGILCTFLTPLSRLRP